MPNFSAFCRSIAIIVSLLFSSLVYADKEEAQGESLKCDVGPVVKEFGYTRWSVFSCNDSESLVFVPVSGSPAMPFYFMTTLQHGERKLIGDGTGSKDATSAAHHALVTLIELESRVQALIAETIAAHNDIRDER